MNKELEVWKSLDFLGYPEYEISNWGQVKSLNYKRTGKEKILKPGNNNGYVYILLYQNKKHKMFRLHRLVALAFIPNPQKLPCVNHIDENKENNHVDNLEFCDIRYNNCYGSRLDRCSKSMKGKHHSEETKQKISKAMKGKYVDENNPMYGKHHSEETKQKISKAIKKPIQQYTKDMTFIKEFDSAKSASIELKINHSNITACCKGKLKSAGKFIWRYKE